MRILRCTQGGEEWAEAKRGIASASNANRVITPSKGEFSKQAEDYGCELIAESMLPPHFWLGDDVCTRDMMRGNNTEGEARDYFELERGVEIEQVGCVFTDDNRFCCSPDGLIGDGEGLELKCPKHKTQIRYLIDGVLPVEYAPQVHWSMIVTQRPVWNFMSYAVGLPPLIIRVERSDYTVKVAEAMEKFWQLLTEMRAKIPAADPVGARREYVSPF